MRVFGVVLLLLGLYGILERTGSTQGFAIVLAMLGVVALTVPDDEEEPK